jgi:hypothetical protein
MIMPDAIKCRALASADYIRSKSFSMLTMGRSWHNIISGKEKDH